MQSRNRSILACAMMVTAVAVLVIGAAATPAMAAGKETQGFFVALDLANTQPTGLDQHYGTLIDQTTGFQETAILNNDADFTWQLKFGYSWGNMGALSIAYWSFDNEDGLSKSDANNAIYPTVFGGYAYNNGGTYGLFPYYNVGYGVTSPVTYETGSNLKASTLDIDYSRPMMAGEKMTISWVAGLRSASWEEDQTFSGTSNYYYGDPLYTTVPNYGYDQSKHIESDAFGVKVGANIKFGFTEHFSLGGGMAFSFLQGNNDAQMNQTSTVYAGGVPVGSTVDQITSSDDNVRGEIRDFDVRAMWDYGSLGFWLGYGGQTWSGLVADPSGEAPCCSATRTAHSSRDTVAFNSLHAGVAFRFGGKK